MSAAWLIGSFGCWAGLAGSGAGRNLGSSLTERIIATWPVKGSVFRDGTPTELTTSRQEGKFVTFAERTRGLLEFLRFSTDFRESQNHKIISPDILNRTANETRSAVDVPLIEATKLKLRS
ncbi:hypothetical protein F5882DRAFT_385643 [Hyaloscypha sp. PMI_1271]|nr:hypothetical protein F5882DRAFT_385643 [Hyaloscypha sp. PMI_1271]